MRTSHTYIKKVHTIFSTIFPARVLQYIYAIAAVLVLSLWIYVWVQKNVISIQKTSQSREKTSLEQSWWLAEWSLQDIAGNLYIWPYRDLRKQRYAFLWEPNRLQFWLYNLTYDDAKRWLHERWIYGTKIQWILEANQYGGSWNQYSSLEQHFLDNRNIELQSDTRLWITFQHAKTFVADERFIIQTANVTYSSFNKNRELFFFGTHTGVALSLQQLFATDWRWWQIDKWSLHPNLIVCPVNCRDHIEGLLRHANQSIYMYQQYILDNDIQKILLEKKKEWVDVKVILWKPLEVEKNTADTKKEVTKVIQMWSSLSDIQSESADSSDSIDSIELTMDNTLSSRGWDDVFASIMWDSIIIQSSPYVHAKWILVDNTYLLVWSMNMSDTSLDKNREIWILLLWRFQIEKFLKVFMSDWVKWKWK